jgi:hypothetical protein
MQSKWIWLQPGEHVHLRFSASLRQGRPRAFPLSRSIPLRHLVLAACLSAFAATTPAAAQMITLSPAQIGEIFCLGRLGNDMAPVEAILTPALSVAIAEAEARNDAIQQEHPDEKPPLGDGIPWQSYPDYAAHCAAEVVTRSTQESRVAISYGFPEYPDADFTDMLVLKLVEPSGPGATDLWRIDNVIYATEGNLQDLLVDAFAAD